MGENIQKKPDPIFHRSVFTSRSTGYKYRTLATNTVGKTIDVDLQTMIVGEKRQRFRKEDNIFERKFREFRDLIMDKVDKHFEETSNARNLALARLEEIDMKVQQMVDFQKTIHELRRNLTAAENTLAVLTEKVDQLDVYPRDSDSTLMFIPTDRNNLELRDVLQQRGNMSLLFGGDYYTNNIVDILPMKRNR